MKKLTSKRIDNLMRENGLESVAAKDFRCERNQNMTYPEQDRYDADLKFARDVEAEVLRINGLTAESAEQREQGQAWAVRTVGGKKWLAIHASKSASDKWLEFKRKEQARSEIYEQIALKEIGVIMESQTISRGDFTGEQLRAAYHPTPPAWVPDGYALAMAVLQSDLYLKLDDQARAQCDAMLSAAPQPAAQDIPAIFKEQAS